MCSSMAILSRLKRALTFKTEVVTFLQLDYRTMLELFDRIPLYDLVRLNGLAGWWSGYVHKVCRIKRSITVQYSSESELYLHPAEDQFNLLRVTSIDALTSERLGHLLPNITSLEIIIEGKRPFSTADVSYLISQWGHQLVSLELKCGSRYTPEDYSGVVEYGVGQLLSSLNRVTTLRHLLVHCQSWERGLSEPINLPILSQLEYFYFYSGYNDFLNLRDSLIQYVGPNDNLKQIELLSFEYYRSMNDLLREHQLLSKLSRISLFGVTFTRDQWALFTNLSTIKLYKSIDTRSEFMDLITDMTNLKHLQNLCMKLYLPNDFDHNPDQVLANVPQLPSITYLNLCIELRRPPSDLSSTFKSLQVNREMFPNVQTAYFEYDFTYSFNCCLGSGRVVKWMGQIARKLCYRKFKRRMRRQFAGVECTIIKPHFSFVRINA